MFQRYSIYLLILRARARRFKFQPEFSLGNLYLTENYIQEQQKFLSLHFFHELHQSELKRRKLYQIRVHPSKKLNFTANSKPIGSDFPAAGERRRLTASGRSFGKSGNEGERERCSVLRRAQCSKSGRRERERESVRASEHARPRASRVCVFCECVRIRLGTNEACVYVCMCVKSVCVSVYMRGKSVRTCERRVFARAQVHENCVRLKKR